MSQTNITYVVFCSAQELGGLNLQFASIETLTIDKRVENQLWYSKEYFCYSVFHQLGQAKFAYNGSI
jgi:hypothetical protein